MMQLKNKCLAKTDAQELGKPKDDIVDAFDWDLWKTRARDYLTPPVLATVYKEDKQERDVVIKAA